MALVPLVDAVYLLAETTSSPSHVVALQIFRPPADGSTTVDDVYRRMTTATEVKPAFRRRPRRSLRTAGMFEWDVVEAVDLDAHVRRTSVAAPGRVRELLAEVAAFHETPLPRDRPLWEALLVDGLADRRFALLTKLHHSQFDGVNMGRHLLGGLSPDPARRGGTAPWVALDDGHRRRPRRGQDGWSVRAGLGAGLAAVTAAAEFVRTRPLPFTAPMTPMNGKVGPRRRFAGDDWPVARLRDLSRAAGVSFNDVVLAMCAGALRGYFDEIGVPLTRSLVAMVPVSFDPSHDGAAGDGNAWTAVLCDLATDTDDVRARLGRIHATMSDRKKQVARMGRTAASVLGTLMIGGAVLNVVPGTPPLPRPPFNLILSSIPAVPRTLYLDGCELTDNYPVSVVVDGQALNITTVSYVDRIAFGITGCADSIPHLQRLLVHLDKALSELEDSVAPA